MDPLLPLRPAPRRLGRLVTLVALDCLLAERRLNSEGAREGDGETSKENSHTYIRNMELTATTQLPPTLQYTLSDDEQGG